MPSPAWTKQLELLGLEKQYPQTPAAAKHLCTHAVQQGEVPGGRQREVGRGRTEGMCPSGREQRGKRKAAGSWGIPQPLQPLRDWESRGVGDKTQAKGADEALPS